MDWWDFLLDGLVVLAGKSPRTPQTTLRSCFAFAVFGLIIALVSIAVIRKPFLHDSHVWMLVVVAGSAVAGLIGMTLTSRRVGVWRGTRTSGFVYGALFAFVLLTLRFVYETSGG